MKTEARCRTRRDSSGTGLLAENNDPDQVIRRCRVTDHLGSQTVFESGEKSQSLLVVTIRPERFGQSGADRAKVKPAVFPDQRVRPARHIAAMLAPRFNIWIA